MRLSRKWILVVSLVMSLAMATTGTLAYLTDRDSRANVLTFGNVEIELNEDFEQGGALIPGKDIVKDVKVTNTGKNDAWVWVKIAIPTALDDDDASKNVLHFNYGKDTVGDGLWTWTDENGEWMVQKNVKNPAEGADGADYNVYTVLYQTALKPGDQTEYSAMEKVYLDIKADVDPNGDLYLIKNGVATPVMKDDNTQWNVATDTYMHVSAYAIQTEGFKTVQEAYAAYNAQWNDKGMEWGVPAVEVNTEADIDEDVLTRNEGADEVNIDINNHVINKVPIYADTETTKPVVVNGNGKTITSTAASAEEFTWSNDNTIPNKSMIFSSANGAKVTVNDLTFNGTMSAIMLGNYVNATYNDFNTELNNVDVINAKVVSFSANVAPAVCVYGTAVLNDCNIYGTTLSRLDTDPAWPVYDLVVVNYTDTTLNDCKIGSIMAWNQAKLTVADGTEVDSIVIKGNMNTSKYGITIKSGAAVGKIDLSAITDKSKVNITIEDGATVGKFVANGVEYASIAEWQGA